MAVNQPLSSNEDWSAVPLLSVVESFQVKANENLILSAGGAATASSIQLSAADSKVVLQQGPGLPAIQAELTLTGLTLTYGLWTIELTAAGVTLTVGTSKVVLGAAGIELSFAGVNKITLGPTAIAIAAGTASVNLDGTANSLTVAAPAVQVKGSPAVQITPTLTVG